jgi:hypothetical protein
METAIMANFPINPNVKIDPTDTRVHIGITCFPLYIDTVRFTPLTDKGREILELYDDEVRLSTTLDRGYTIYDAIGACGYSTQEEILTDTDQPSKWESVAKSLQQDVWNR